jgi:signal transduction histidine kinase
MMEKLRDNPQTILVIDDDSNLLRTQSRLLKKAGYRVEQADTGEKGIARAKTQKPDLILLDVILPDSNGFDVCQRIKNDPELKDIYVLLISGKNIHSRDQAKGLELGADGYVVRPIANRELLARVQSLLRLKQTENKLREARRELTAANNDLQEFAYAISHDLSEPLRMITSFLDLLKRRFADQLDEDAREYIHFAVDGANRMKKMIDGILAYSRIQTRGRNFESFSSLEAYQDAVKNLQKMIADLDAVMPVGSLPDIYGDRIQFTQLFQNLISNALTYNESQVPRVEVEVEKSEGQWLFSVADNGIGIPLTGQERIFTVFQRLHTQDDYPGAGVGLTICKRIVERHEGEIWVESIPDQGSTFYFSIPIKDVEE